MARLFFDISDIATYIRHHSSISGIQRAAVMIITEAARHAGPETVYLSVLRPGETKHLCCPAADLIDVLERFDTVALGEALGVKARRTTPTAPFLDRYRDKPLKLRFHTARLTRALNKADRAYLKKRGVDYDMWRALHPDREARAPVTLRPLDEVAAPGDAICALGSFWGLPKAAEAFRAAHNRGMRVFVLVHDLIPMKLPETVDFKTALSFYDWLADTVAYCTGYLANSASTARDLQAFLQELGQTRPITVTPLAQAALATPALPGINGTRPEAHAETLARSKTAGTMSGAVREATQVPYVLSVGTIEPRKNLWRLVQAWQHLAQDPTLDMPRLVLAGKRGWLTDGFLDMLARTGGLGGWVTYLEAPRDVELDYLYRNCLFTATVSLYEGWGLPIGEGLGYGKTGVVARVASMPEVGGNMVEYCDPHSVRDITRALRTLVATPDTRVAYEETIAKTQLRNWADVGRDVVAAITAG